MTKHLRVLHPAEGLIAFYDGRVAGYRFADDPNWVDNGALSLGIASYALVAGDEALVYDAQTTVEHARFIRSHLERLGVRRLTLVLSHWHLDHVAGNEAFADCEIIANRKTAAHLARHKAAIEAGTHHGPPAIDPLVMPNRLFDDRLVLRLGGREIHLIEADIHSDDATVLWLPDKRLLLAGDTLEDTVTYVAEPEHFGRHLADLTRLAALEPKSILPNHGDPGIIAAGGYGPSLIAATRAYVERLRASRHDAALRALSLADFVAPELAAGWITYFAPYKEVHRANVEKALAAEDSV